MERSTHSQAEFPVVQMKILSGQIASNPKDTYFDLCLGRMEFLGLKQIETPL